MGCNKLVWELLWDCYVCTFSKTDWKVMDQCKEKKGKGTCNQKWRLARISTAVQACIFPGLPNCAALRQPKVIYAVRRKFLKQALTGCSALVGPLEGPRRSGNTTWLALGQKSSFEK